MPTEFPISFLSYAASCCKIHVAGNPGEGIWTGQTAGDPERESQAPLYH